MLLYISLFTAINGNIFDNLIKIYTKFKELHMRARQLVLIKNK